MDTVSLAGMAMNLQSAKLQQAVGVAVLKKQMDATAESAQNLIEMMAGSSKALECSVSPHLGTVLDVTA